MTEEDCNLEAGKIIEKHAKLEKRYEKLMVNSKEQISSLKEKLAETEKDRDEIFA